MIYGLIGRLLVWGGAAALVVCSLGAAYIYVRLLIWHYG